MDSGSGSTNAPVNSRTCGPSALGPTGKVDLCLLMNLRVLVSSSEAPQPGCHPRASLASACWNTRSGAAVGAPRAAIESTTR